MARLTDEFLRGVGPRVFREKTTTFAEAGRDIPLAEYRETVEATRADLRATLVSLPDSAFEAQTSGQAEGEDSWAAGQIVSHLTNSFRAMTEGTNTLLGIGGHGNAERLDLTRLPDRAESLALLDQLDSETQAWFEALPEDGDYDATAEHPRFGAMSSKGWLLLMALHENDHLRQTRSLGG